MSTPMADPSRPEAARSPDILRFRRSHTYAALLPLAFVVGLATGFLFWGREAAPAPSVAAVPGTQAPTRLEVSVDDDPALGPADAAA